MSVAGSRIAAALPTTRRPSRLPAADLLRFVSPALPIVAILVLWELGSRSFGIPVLFPSVRDTALKAVALVEEGRLQTDVAMSLMRIAAGFTIGSAIGTLVGLLMGSSRTVAALLNPYLNVMRFISATAWVSVVTIWFGLGETSKIALIVYTTTFVVVLNTMAAVATLHPNKYRAAACFGASRWQTFWHVTLPGAVPLTLLGMRMALMNSFITIAAAEMVAAESGLGFLIFNSRQWMETDAIFVGMITLGLLGLLVDRAFKVVAGLLFARFRMEG